MRKIAVAVVIAALLCVSSAAPASAHGGVVIDPLWPVAAALAIPAAILGTVANAITPYPAYTPAPVVVERPVYSPPVTYYAPRAYYPRRVYVAPTYYAPRPYYPARYYRYYGAYGW